MVNGQRLRFAELTSEQQQTVRAVEQELGEVYVIAYEQEPVPAPLAEEELEKLQEAEQKMPGVVLVAYRKPQPIS